MKIDKWLSKVINGGEETNLLCRIPKKIYVEILPLRRGNKPPHSVGEDCK